MYPPRFHYEAPRTLDEACQMMAYYRDDAKVLSGGMSLVPLMKLRFASPATIVDLNQIEGLDYIEEAGGYLRIGALARNRAIVRSDLCRSRHPLISSAAPTISDPVVRNRGTLVGNCCHGDPQGDWTTVMMCLDGETVAVGVALQQSGGSVSRVGIGLTGVGPSNIKCYNAEQVVSGGGLNEHTIEQAAAAAAADSSPRSDHRGSEEYKREMVAVFVRRSLRAAAGIRAA